MAASLPSTEDFFAAGARGDLLVQRCASCGRQQVLGRIVCPDCGGRDCPWQPHDGRGRVLAVTTVHRAPAGFEDQAPYTIVLADLGAGATVLARQAAGGGRVSGVGDDVVVSWDTTEDEPVLRAHAVTDPGGAG